MTSQKNATSTDQTDYSAAPDIAAANDQTADEATSANDAIIDGNAISDSTTNEKAINDNVIDSGVDLATALTPYFRPDANTIVCGTLDEEKVAILAEAGVEVVINLQPDDELSFDEAATVEHMGMSYAHLPIHGAADLKQLKILAFDNVLRQYHGKKIAIHCGSGNRVGAAIALRAGWLRGRKMDTAMERGRSHGLTNLEDEVYKRLLVPR